MKIKRNNKAEKGNAFFIVLIGVILFAALTFTFTKTSQNTSGNINRSEAKIAATDIISNAQTIEKAINKLLRKGCSEGDISFENNFITGYEHSPQTTNDCKIFNISGGNIKYKTPDNTWLDETKSGNSRYKEWYLTSDICIWESSSAGCNPNPASDLVLILPYIKMEICEQINKTSSITGNIPKDTDGTYSPNAPFTGSYPSNPSNDINIWQSKTGCIEASSSPSSGYHFYHVLISR